MTYYRPRVLVWLWVTLAVTACLVAAARQSIGWIREDERRDVLASVDSLRPIVWQVEYARLARERDSLALETARRDTVLVTRIQRVVAVDTLTLTDTVIVRETLHQCAALAAECDAFRVSATAALAKADSTRAADSLAAVRLALLVVDRDRRITQLDRRPTWGTVMQSCTVAGAMGVVGGFFLR